MHDPLAVPGELMDGSSVFRGGRKASHRITWAFFGGGVSLIFWIPQLLLKRKVIPCHSRIFRTFSCMARVGATKTVRADTRQTLRWNIQYLSLGARFFICITLLRLEPF